MWFRRQYHNSLEGLDGTSGDRCTNPTDAPYACACPRCGGVVDNDNLEVREWLLRTPTPPAPSPVTVPTSEDDIARAAAAGFRRPPAQFVSPAAWKFFPSNMPPFSEEGWQKWLKSHPEMLVVDNSRPHSYFPRARRQVRPLDQPPGPEWPVLVNPLWAGVSAQSPRGQMMHLSLEGRGGSPINELDGPLASSSSSDSLYTLYSRGGGVLSGSGAPDAIAPAPLPQPSAQSAGSRGDHTVVDFSQTLADNEIWLILLNGERVKAIIDSQRNIVYQGRVFNEDESFYSDGNVFIEIDPAALTPRTRGAPVSSYLKDDDASSAASPSGRCTCAQGFLAQIKDLITELTRNTPNSKWPGLRQACIQVFSLTLTVTVWTFAVYKETTIWGVTIFMALFAGIYDLLQSFIKYLQDSRSYPELTREMGGRNGQTAQPDTWSSVITRVLEAVSGTAVLVSMFLGRGKVVKNPDPKDILNNIFVSALSALVIVGSDLFVRWVIARIGPNPRRVARPLVTLWQWIKCNCSGPAPEEAQPLLPSRLDGQPPSVLYWIFTMGQWTTATIIALLFLIGFTNAAAFERFLTNDIFTGHVPALKQSYEQSYLLLSWSGAGAFISAAIVVLMMRMCGGRRRQVPASPARNRLCTVTFTQAEIVMLDAKLRNVVDYPSRFPMTPELRGQLTTLFVSAVTRGSRTVTLSFTSAQRDALQTMVPTSSHTLWRALMPPVQVPPEQTSYGGL